MGDQQAFRKVGRGGAGNFYSSHQVDNADRVHAPSLPFPRDPDSQALQDLEAQERSAAPPDAFSSSGGHAFARAGRGGAGNYVDPAQLPDAHEQEEAVAAAVSARRKQQHPRGGLAGRGGAGNWKPEDESGLDEEKKSWGEELERKAREMVDKGLKMPEKIHQSHHKGEVDG